MLGAKYDANCQEVSQSELGEQATTSCRVDGEGTGPTGQSTGDHTGPFGLQHATIYLCRFEAIASDSDCYLRKSK